MSSQVSCKEAIPIQFSYINYKIVENAKMHDTIKIILNCYSISLSLSHILLHHNMLEFKNDA